MLDRILQTIKKFIPRRFFHVLQPLYHYLLALIGALRYGFPSRKVRVVGVTGTKGKSTTVELINTILEEAGYTTAVLGTIRFKVADTEERNLFKMTMPGRFFIQHFLRRAVHAGCDWVVLEMTSEGVKQFRHKFIALDALIFTNLSPEHIESHGSFAAYRDAKRKLGHVLTRSRKKDRTIIANADDKEGSFYLGLPVPHTHPFSLSHAEPYRTTDDGVTFTYRKTLITSPLKGIFNLMNMLAASTFATSVGIEPDTIKDALERFRGARGRVEYVSSGQPFAVVVDYAHTPDSLEQFYGVFKNQHTICVLGNTGGGRDTWKRPKMAEIAEMYCSEIILTNEDPYDEDPRKIVDEMADGITNKEKLSIIMDRRAAIRESLVRANTLQPSNENINVLITGKGTDPYIMGVDGAKEPWDDATVVREELVALGYSHGRKQ